MTKPHLCAECGVDVTSIGTAFSKKHRSDCSMHPDNIIRILKDRAARSRPSQATLEKYDSVIKARRLFTDGQQFRVIADGARMEGMVPYGPADKVVWAGWSRRLLVGEIVVCNGWRLGWDQSTVECANFTANGVPENAGWINIWPQSGMWRPYPMDGFLEPIHEGDDNDR